MALKVVTLSNIPKLKTAFSRLKTFFICFCFLAILYGIFGSGGSFIGRFFICFLALPFLSIPIVVYSKIRFILGKDFKKVHQAKRQQLIEQGFRDDFEGVGLLIDNQNKKMAFTLSQDNNDAYISDFTDVRSWYSTAHNEETQYRNAQGAYAGSSTTTLQRTITITIANAEYPEFKFLVFNPNESNQWIARLDALINS